MTTMSGDAVPLAEADFRIRKLQTELRRCGADAALIVQKTDLFYFSGTAQQGWLFIPADGQPLLFVFKDFARAREETPLERIESITSVKRIPEMLAEYGYRESQVIGLELDVLPVNLYHQYQKVFAGVEFIDVSTQIRLIRAVKSDWEVERIRAAARCSDLVCEKVSEVLAVGKTEIELAGELEAYARSLGHQGIVRMRMWGSELFYGHLLSGPDAATPSYLQSPTGGSGPSRVTSQGAGFKRIEADEAVLFDYVFALHGYLSDHTRIFCAGSLPDDLLRIHGAMVEIQNDVMEQALPGVSSGAIYELMIDAAERRGCGEWFMGTGERRIRFTGHGIGLELDEFPFIAKNQTVKLEKNMVIALEPKAIIPGSGVVGTENTFVVKDHGLERLTMSPDSITFVEKRSSREERGRAYG